MNHRAKDVGHLTVALVIILVGVLTSQVIVQISAPKRLNARLWAGTRIDDGYDVAVSADGSVYLAGYTNSFGVGGPDAFLANYNDAGTQLWNRTWGGESDDHGNSVAVSADGLVYLAGYTRNITDYRYDAFIAKYNAAGTQLWNRTWGGMASASGYGVAISGDGSVYLAGSTSIGAGSSDAFLAKYDATGTQLWNRTWGGTNSEGGYGVTVATDGSVFLAGSTDSFGSGDSDAFLVKYNATGTQLWNRTWGGVKNDIGSSVAVKDNDSVYLAGSTESLEASSSDAFLAKYNSTGMQQWNQSWSGGYWDEGYDVAVAADGSVYLTGVSRIDIVFRDAAFLAKYDATGTHLWDRIWDKGSNNADRAYGRGVSVSGDGSVYLAGYLFLAGIAGADSYDYAFLAKYNPSGNPLWLDAPGFPFAEVVLVVSVALGLTMVTLVIRRWRRQERPGA